MNELTAKNFREPLLLALGRRTNYNPTTSAPMAEVVAQVCTNMGVQADAYGVTEQGISQVQRWIQLAFMQLVDKGLGIRTGRGSWALSPEGISEALSLGATSLTIAPPPVIEEPEREPTPILDSYIQGLLASQTACYGHFSADKAPCSTCLIREDCFNRRDTLLFSLLPSLDAPVEEDGSRDEETGAPLSLDPSLFTVRHITNRLEQPCQHCGNPLAVGVQVAWVRGVKVTEDAHNGTYHTDCIKVG